MVRRQCGQIQDSCCGLHAPFVLSVSVQLRIGALQYRISGATSNAHSLKRERAQSNPANRRPAACLAERPQCSDRNTTDMSRTTD